MTTATAKEVTRAPRAMNRTQAADFCTTEYARLAALLRELTPDEWRRPTECAPWDVRAMAGHLVGAAEAASLAAFMRQALAGMRVHHKPGLGNLVDGVNEVQIGEQASLSTGALVDALERAAPAQVRTRRSPAWYTPFMPVPTPVNWISLRTLRVAVLNRDLWIHRVDICRATGRPMELTAGPRWRHRRGHRGRRGPSVTGSRTRWCSRGPPAARTQRGDGASEVRLDAVEFCRIVSGRAPGDGLLATPVLF